MADRRISVGWLLRQFFQVGIYISKGVGRMEGGGWRVEWGWREVDRPPYRPFGVAVAAWCSYHVEEMFMASMYSMQ